MIQNFNLFLLCGGYHLCDNWWNKTATELDQCFKLYFPIKGSATITIDGDEKNIESGKIYYISGFHINRQHCDNEMELYWVHFMPDSLMLRYILNHINSFHYWETIFNCFNQQHLKVFPQLFSNQMELKNRENQELYAPLACKAQSIILYFLSDLLKNEHVEANLKEDKVLTQLVPSIEFMNNNLNQFPSLKNIADVSYLAPNYFHRLFSETFKITPLNYMNQRRLNIAKQLLVTTPKSIKEISSNLGFKSEFYFSRMFKKYLKISPSDFRTKKLSIN